MRRMSEAELRCLEIMKLCEGAVAEQRNRERGMPYGIDDYTEGRIVGAANLARKIQGILRGTMAAPTHKHFSSRSFAR